MKAVELRRFRPIVLPCVLLPLLAFLMLKLVPFEPRATMYSGHCEFVCFSPDGKTLITRPRGGSFGMPGPVQLWDLEAGGERLALAHNWKQLETISFSPDGKLLAAHEKEGGLIVWDAQTGKQIVDLRPFTQFGNWVNFRFSPDGRFLIVQDYRGNWQSQDRVFVWDIEAGRECGQIEGYFHHMAFSPDGQSLATWHYGKKATALRVSKLGPGLLPAQKIKDHEVVCDGVVVSADLRTFITAACPDNRELPAVIGVWDIDSGKRKASFSFTDRETHVQDLKLSLDGRVLFIHSGGGTQLAWTTRVRVWDVSASPREIGTFSTNPDLSPDGRLLAVPQFDGADLFLTDGLVKCGSLIDARDSGPSRRFMYNNHIEYPKVIFSPDGKAVVVSGICQDATSAFLARWLPSSIDRFRNWGSGMVVRVWDAASCEQWLTIHDCYEAQFAPDGRTMAARQLDGTIQLWDWPLRKPLGMVVGLTILSWSAIILAAWLVRLWLWSRRRRTILCNVD